MHVQIQLLKCTAGDGSVVLSFRDEVTSVISYDATQHELKAILEELPTIDAVDVSYDSGFSTFCDATGGHIVQVKLCIGELYCKISNAL